MYEGDRSRKQTLVDYGFRLPSALDNRPLRIDEFMALVPRILYVSATPGEEELRLSGGVVVEQIIRPTCGSTRRSEEHTSELQSRLHLVCRLLLEKKKNTNKILKVDHKTGLRVETPDASDADAA